VKRARKIVVVGGGIVGLATAYRLLQRAPELRVRLLEKEPEIARHQTGRNSGVLHTGIYYRPGSQRALTCVAGRAEMAAFCEREGVPYEICGKVIVAADPAEIPRLDVIHRRGIANGVACALIEMDRLRELEPHVRGVRAVHVHDAGIVDFSAVARRLAYRIEEAGGEISLATEVTGVRRIAGGIEVLTPIGPVAADYLVTCAGLHSDRLARMAGADPGVKIVPFRGEYYELAPDARHLCRNLVYPVPDPSFPFLGVHFTRTIEGRVECGPNAVLALGREGYRWRDLNPRDIAESITYPGFLRLARANLRYGLGEVWRSVSKRAFVSTLQKLVPEVRAEHLERAPAGVRAQAVGRDGRLVEDFVVVEGESSLHVCNAPSPAATASLHIGAVLAERALAHAGGG
jgi:(S)-2-hydroxyglutarate dehydrogenase